MIVLNLIFVYNVCLSIGIVIPLLSILLGFAGSLFDFDFDFDIDTQFDGLFSFNPMTIILSLAIFGGIGKIILLLGVPEFWSLIISLILSLKSGLLIIKYIVRPLKKNKSFATNTQNLIGKSALVLCSISEQHIGEIETIDESGSQITYLAKSIDNSEIKKGSKVVIKDFAISEDKVYTYAIVIAE